MKLSFVLLAGTMIQCGDARLSSGLTRDRPADGNVDITVQDVECKFREIVSLICAHVGNYLQEGLDAIKNNYTPLSDNIAPGRIGLISKILLDNVSKVAHDYRNFRLAEGEAMRFLDGYLDALQEADLLWRAGLNDPEVTRLVELQTSREITHAEYREIIRSIPADDFEGVKHLMMAVLIGQAA